MRLTKQNKNYCLDIKMYFLRFFRIYIADQIALFKGLLPPPNDGGELVFDDDMLHPIQGRLHRLLGQTEDIQQIIFLWVTGYSLPKPDKAKTGDVCVSGLVVGQPLPHYGGGVNWRIVPVEHPALFSPMRPLLLQNL